MTEVPLYYAWVVVDDDGEGLIAATVPGMPGLVPLVNRSYDIALQMRPYAIAHGNASGLTVRLVSFRRDQVLEEIAPK